MKKIALLLALTCLLVSCSATKKASEKSTNQYSSSIITEIDGSSFEKAILIKEKTEMAGVDAEYAWIRQNYPGSQLKGQYLFNKKKRSYDVIEIITSDGIEKSIYFDISSFFGKF
jgi:PBP1b-binding outer membrane lipoprotein LpoB